MKQSPSWEAARPATQKYIVYKEPIGSLSCSQESATGPWDLIIATIIFDTIIAIVIPVE
jgi:hypothetical protein